VTDPRILLNWGVGAARTVEDSEKKEIARNVEVFMVNVGKVRQAELLKSEEMKWQLGSSELNERGLFQICTTPIYSTPKIE